MRTTRRFTSRGFSLVEMLISLAVLGLVITFAGVAIVGQQRLFVSTSKLRQAQGQTRSGLAFLERSLSLAGYGIEPALAIDFNIYAGTSDVARGPNGRVCPTTGCVRDRVDGPDELVVAGRDPRYWGQLAGARPEGRAWTVIAAGTNASQIELEGVDPGEILPAGQILQIVCPGAARSAYVTLASRLVGPTGTTEANLIGSLAPAESGNPFRQNGQLTGPSCLRLATTRVFAVFRHRYYVAVPDPVSRVPYLMLDEGLDWNSDGQVDTADHRVIAEGVEDLQIAYERPSPAGVPTTVGNSPGVALEQCAIAGAITAGGDCANGVRVVTFNGREANLEDWSYHLASGAARHSSADAGNINAIHVALTVRSVTGALDREGMAPPLNFNRNASLPAAAGFERATFTTVIRTLNVRSASLSFL